jgi:hypothetical protein
MIAKTAERPSWRVALGRVGRPQRVGTVTVIGAVVRRFERLRNCRVGASSPAQRGLASDLRLSSARPQRHTMRRSGNAPRMWSERGSAELASTSLCELTDATDGAFGAYVERGQTVSMNGVVFAFPDRHTRDGVRWEPWVDETVIARHFDVSTRTVRRWRADGMPSKLIGCSRRYRISHAESWHERRSA